MDIQAIEKYVEIACQVSGRYLPPSFKQRLAAMMAPLEQLGLIERVGDRYRRLAPMGTLVKQYRLCA
jgi:hypothetical protein